MSLLQGKEIKYSIGNRELFQMEKISIEPGDRIGLVGANGVGKTTLLKLLSGLLELEEGTISVSSKATIAYVSQLDMPNAKTLPGKYASIFGVNPFWDDHMSGGEKTRFKLAEGFSKNASLLLVDEPTNNLDLEGIELVTTIFTQQASSYLLVSHNRFFLDEVCNQIWEIEQGKLNCYTGNYSQYLQQKEIKEKHEQFEYESYQKEKTRLLKAQKQVKAKSSKTKRTPSRMGNSEARLHRMGGQKAKKHLDNKAKALEQRLTQLEKKESPKENEVIRVQLPDSSKSYSKVLFSGEKVYKAFGDKVILKDAQFQFCNGKKVALIGKNGIGKTTLLRMILQGEGIDTSPSVRIGYFSQSLDNLNKEKTVLENVMEDSVQTEQFARLVLARLLIKGDMVHRTLGVLSGGEQIKVSFAKLILGNYNLLILDEPTNHLDIQSIEVIEELLYYYEGSLLLVSHDRGLIDKVATEVWNFEHEKITAFLGSYSDYLLLK